MTKPVDAPTLRDVIRSAVVGAGHGQATDRSIRERRERLANYVRAHERLLLRAGHDGDVGHREPLGWDDESLHAFIHSSLAVNSSPHASMNAFPPMLFLPWLAQQVQVAALRDDAVHLRTAAVHNNFGDNRWKPHAWWRLTVEGRVTKTVLFSRRPRMKRVVAAESMPELPDDMTRSDAAATEFAAGFRSFGHAALAYRMSLERMLGFHTTARTLEVPLDLIVGFMLEEFGPEAYMIAQKLDDMSQHVRYRHKDSGELCEASAEDFMSGSPEAQEWLFPNFVHLTFIRLLGVDVMLGAEKMARYVPRLEPLTTILFSDSDLGVPPEPQLLTMGTFPAEAAAASDIRVRRELHEFGITNSLPILAALSGEEDRTCMDWLLDEPYERFCAR